VEEEEEEQEEQDNGYTEKVLRLLCRAMIGDLT
jgi:hypothetical protein